MATFDQVMQALRNADAAGNAEDAKRLAQIAQSMRQPKADPYYNGPGEDLTTGPQTPPPVEQQGPIRSTPNRAGDVTMDLMEQPLAAAKAYGAGFIDQSKSPTMQAMPESWNPALKSFYARFGDAGMAALSALGAGYAGAAGIVGEAIGSGRADEQRLANDLMMMGQVAVPELAGVSSVGRAAMSVPGKLERAGAPTAKQAAARAAGDIGVTPSLGMTGKTGAMASAALEKVPGAGSIIAKDAARAVGEVEAAFAKSVANIGKPVSAYEAGGKLQSGLNKFVLQFKDRAGKLYDAIPIQSGAKVKADNTVAAIADAKAVFAENPQLAQKLGLTNWDSVASEISANNISWQALKQFRTEVGEAIGKSTGALTDTGTGRLKQLYGALTADMEAAAKAAGPEAASAWNRANAFYKSGAKRIERSLDATITAKNPERAFEAFDALTKADRSSSDLQRMRQIRASMTRDDWNDVSASIVQRLGRSKPGAQSATGDVFSPSSFLTEWNKLSPEARKLLLPEDARVELEKLAKVAESVKSGNLERNMSNTGTVIMAAGAGGSFVSHPVATISALGGANIAARALTNPVFLRALNRAARGDVKALEQLASGKGAFTKDAATVLRLMAAETATGGAANRDATPATAASR